MKGIRLNGKGVTVWDLSNVAFTLMFIGIAVAVGVWTNDQVSSTAYTATNMNDSVNFAANDTYYQLTYRARTVHYIENATYRLGETGDTSGNYTCTLQGYETWCQILSTRDGGGAVGTYNVNYDAMNSSAHFITMNATEGMNRMAQWLPIVMVVIAAAIVIASLALWFGKR